MHTQEIYVVFLNSNEPEVRVFFVFFFFESPEEVDQMLQKKICCDLLLDSRAHVSLSSDSKWFKKKQNKHSHVHFSCFDAREAVFESVLNLNEGRCVLLPMCTLLWIAMMEVSLLFKEKQTNKKKDGSSGKHAMVRMRLSVFTDWLCVLLFSAVCSVVVCASAVSSFSVFVK